MKVLAILFFPLTIVIITTSCNHSNQTMRKEDYDKITFIEKEFNRQLNSIVSNYPSVFPDKYHAKSNLTDYRLIRSIYDEHHGLDIRLYENINHELIKIFLIITNQEKPSVFLIPFTENYWYRKTACSKIDINRNLIFETKFNEVIDSISLINKSDFLFYDITLFNIIDDLMNGLLKLDGFQDNDINYITNQNKKYSDKKNASFISDTCGLEKNKELSYLNKDNDTIYLIYGKRYSMPIYYGFKLNRRSPDKIYFEVINGDCFCYERF
jgi:hypothetical protein